MERRILKLTLLASILGFIETGNCTELAGTMIDASGSVMIRTAGRRIVDDGFGSIPGAVTISSFFNRLQTDYEGVLDKITLLNLSGNFLLDNGAKVVANFSVHTLPSLYAIDLSFNRIGKEGLGAFAPLLMRNNFGFLNIVGNNEAATLEGLNLLQLRLQEYLQRLAADQEVTYDPDYVRKKIFEGRLKVIWLPETWLDGENAKRYAPEYIPLHKKYYELLKSLPRK